MSITIYAGASAPVAEQRTTNDVSAFIRSLISILDGTNIDLSYSSATGVISASITGQIALANGGTAVDGSSQAINRVFASPGSGGAGAASFRALVAADIPSVTSATISDFTEAVQDVVGAFATDGTNIDVVYSDVSNTLTFNITGTLAKGNLPSAIAYEDEANTFALLQTFTLGLTSNSTAAINGAAGTVRNFAFTTGGVNRWLVRCNATAEGGANAGSDLMFISRADDGSNIGNALSITRSTMAAAFAAALTIGGALDHDGSTAGVFGVTPASRTAAFTQTYATADRTHAARTAAALTDSVAGSVGTTLSAIPDPALAPLSATVLRDDLVNNVLPKIRNALSSIADQVNKERTDALDTAQLANSILDDLQIYGWCQ